MIYVFYYLDNREMKTINSIVHGSGKGFWLGLWLNVVRNFLNISTTFKLVTMGCEYI